MKTVSVRFSARELAALEYLQRYWNQRTQSNVIRRLVKDAARSAGFGELSARPVRRRG